MNRSVLSIVKWCNGTFSIISDKSQRLHQKHMKPTLYKVRFMVIQAVWVQCDATISKLNLKKVLDWRAALGAIKKWFYWEEKQTGLVLWWKKTKSCDLWMRVIHSLFFLITHLWKPDSPPHTRSTWATGVPICLTDLMLSHGWQLGGQNDNTCWSVYWQQIKQRGCQKSKHEWVNFSN